MSCKFLAFCPVSSDVCSKVRKASDCKCYKAVMRAFEEMLDEPRSVAFDAALRVYRHHYPHDNKMAAHLTVDHWVNAGRVQ